MENIRIKNQIIVFVLCLSVVLPGLISEVITTNSLISQDNDIQMDTLMVDDPVGGTTFVVNAPEHIAPVNALITFDQTVTISWGFVALAMGFELQIDLYSDFPSPLIDVYTGLSTTFTTETLGRALYYWRVRARVLDGIVPVWQDWSEPWHFIVNYIAPSLVSPSNGITTFDSTPTLDWNGVTAASVYYLQIDDSSTFSSINYQYSTSTTDYTPSLPNGIWYWRIYARDSDGNSGPYSDYRSFRVDTTSPSLFFPANGMITTDTTPSLVWGSVAGATIYEIQIDDNPSFSSPYTIQTASTSISSPTLSDGVWYCRVRARDVNNYWGSFSGYRYFTVDTTDPVITSVSHSPSSPDDDDSVSVSCQVSDTNGVSVVRVFARVNGGSWNLIYMTHLGGDTYSATIGTFNYADVVEYYITAEDNASPSPNIATDNNGGAYYSFTVTSSDVTAPGIWFVTHSPFTPDDTESVTISCDTNDTNGILSVTLFYRINGGTWINEAMIYDTGDTFSRNIGMFAYGTLIEYYIISIDNSPNANAGIENNSGAFYSFTIISSDNEGPEITAVQNDPVSPNDAQTVNITCTVTDLNGIQTVTLHYRINSGSWINISMIHLSGDVYSAIIGAFSYNTVIEYFISATDDYVLHNEAVEDNTGSYYSFTILSSDVTGPEITTIAHDPSSPTDLDLVNVTCDVFDINGIHNVTLFYRVDSSAWDYISMTLLSGSTYNATIGPFNYGEQIEYYILAYDDYVLHNSAVEDNTGAYYNFTILSGDVTLPVISNISHSPLAPTELDSITISCDVTDASGIQNVYIYYRIDGGSWLNYALISTTGDTFSRVLDPFDYDEVIEYYIRAFDDSPNHNEVTDDSGGLYYSFTIEASDDTAPTINSIEYEPLLPTELNSINITCFVWDANGISSVILYYRINNGTWMQLAMTLTTDNIYLATLGPFDIGDEVDYYITATDDTIFANEATNDNNGDYYRIVIFDSATYLPVPITYYIPLIAMISLIVLIRKRK